MTLNAPDFTEIAGGVEDHGQFPRLSSDFLAALGDVGISRVGIALAILSPDGKILAHEHRGNEKVLPGTKGIPSETLNKSKDGQIEPVDQAMVRGIVEELDHFPLTGEFTTRDERPYTITEWPIGNRIPGSVLGINYAMLASEEVAFDLSGEKTNDETVRAFFTNIGNLLRFTDLRPGTETCLKSLGEVGLLSPDNLGESIVELPNSPNIRLV